MSSAKLAVACGFAALALSACGTAAKPVAGSPGVATSPGTRGKIDDPRTTMNNHLACIRARRLAGRRGRQHRSPDRRAARRAARSTSSRPPARRRALRSPAGAGRRGDRQRACCIRTRARTPSSRRSRPVLRRESPGNRPALRGWHAHALIAVLALMAVGVGRAVAPDAVSDRARAPARRVIAAGGRRRRPAARACRPSRPRPPRPPCPPRRVRRRSCSVSESWSGCRGLRRRPHCSIRSATARSAR